MIPKPPFASILYRGDTNEIRDAQGDQAELWHAQTWIKNMWQPGDRPVIEDGDGNEMPHAVPDVKA